MSKHKAILSSLLGKTLKMTSDEISELIEKSDDELNESEVLTALLEKDSKRVGDLRTRLYGEAAKKVEKNVKADFYKTLKTEFELDEDSSDEDIFTNIKTKLNTGKKSGDKLSDDDVKKHPLFLTAESTYKKALADSKKEWEDKLAQVNTQFTKKELGSKVAEKSSSIFLGLNPVLSAEQSKAKNQVSNFVSKFTSMDWEEADGEFYLIEEGKRKEDKHGHAIPLSTLVKAEAEQVFDFKKAESRKGSGDHHDPNKKKPGEKESKEAYSYTGELPGTDAAYTKMMNDRTIPLEDRKAIHNHWESKKAEEAAKN